MKMIQAEHGWLQVLGALSDLPEDDLIIQNEFKAVKDTVLEMNKGSFSDCFKRNKNRNLHRTCLAYVNQMFQQISGINIITWVPPSVSQGFEGASPALLWLRLLTSLNLQVLRGNNF